MSKLDNVKNNKQVEAINNTSKYKKFRQNIAVKVTVGLSMMCYTLRKNNFSCLEEML